MIKKKMKSTRSALTGLTANEEKFAELIANGYDNPTAHEEAFGASSCTRKTLVQKALVVAKKHNVISYVEKTREDIRNRGVIERDWIVDKLKILVDVGMKEQKRSTKFEIWEEFLDSSAANSALDKLIKMGGLYAAEKIETETTVKGKFVLNLKPRTDDSE